MITDFYKVTDTGELLTLRWWDAYSDENGISKVTKNVVAIQWSCNGKTHKMSLENRTFVEILPSKDGLVVYEKSSNDRIFKDELVVYNDDGSERFRVTPPLMRKHSNLKDARIIYSSFTKLGEYKVAFETGRDDAYKATLDLETGELSNIEWVRI